MKQPRILVVGDICTELVLSTTILPPPTGVATAESLEYLPGGKGLLSSVALARLGADAVLLSKVGEDLYGKELCDYLSDEGVDTRYVVRDRERGTATEVTLQERLSSARRLVYAGALGTFGEEDVVGGFISYPDAVILHGELPDAVLDKTCEVVTDKELLLFVASLPDPTRYPLTRLTACEILSVDEKEIYDATGIRPADQERCMRACIALTKKIKAKYVVLRLGERGCFLYDGTFYSFISAYDVPQPEGVSDDEAFAAALVFEYLRSEGDIRRACDYATIVSAVYLSHGGGLRAYPSERDLKRFIARNDIDFELELGLQE